MGIDGDKNELIAELNHQINSPLAAIRNALFLAANRTDDPALHRYLELATNELNAIGAILRETRKLVECSRSGKQECSSNLLTMPATKRAAA